MQRSLWLTCVFKIVILPDKDILKAQNELATFFKSEKRILRSFKLKIWK